MRRYWLPTLIAVTMAVMFWQVPFYETAPVNAATGPSAMTGLLLDNGILPESVLFNPRFTAAMYAGRFCPKSEIDLVGECDDTHGHPLKADCCYRVRWSGCANSR